MQRDSGQERNRKRDLAQENRNLKKQLEDRNALIDKLRSYINDLKNDIDNLRKEKRGLKKENRTLQGELQRAEDIIKKMETGLKEEICSLRSQLAEMQAAEPYKKVFDKYGETFQFMIGLAQSAGQMDEKWLDYLYREGFIACFAEYDAALKKAEKKEKDAGNEAARRETQPSDRQEPEGGGIRQLEQLLNERAQLFQRLAAQRLYLQQKHIVEGVKMILEILAFPFPGAGQEEKSINPEFIALLGRQIQTVFELNKIYPKFQNELPEDPKYQIHFIRDTEAEFSYPGLFLKEGSAYEPLKGFQGKTAGPAGRSSGS